MSVTIKFRRGNSTEWTSSGSTILASGEPGYEVDTGRMKIGNGITPWSGLYYSSIVPTGFIGGSGIDINLGSLGSSATFHVKSAPRLVTTVFNKTGAPVNKFSVVYIDGGQGDQPTIALSIASGEMTSSKTYAVAADTIPNMSTGLVVVAGAITGVNTAPTGISNPSGIPGADIGVSLWLSPSVSGGVTTTKPHAPNNMVFIGTIVRSHKNEGVVEVRIQNGYELEELHNVATTGATNGQFLQYNSVSGLWVPSSSGNFSTLQVNGTGVSVSGHTHTTSDITNFNSDVSGLLPSVSGTGYVSSSFANNRYTISVTGLQPSGNYANSVHSHGNITSSGAIGNVSNLFIKTGPSGVLTATSNTISGSEVYISDELPIIGAGDLLDYVLISMTSEIQNKSSNSHTHGNITNDGRIGSTSGLLVTTGASGIITTSSGINSNYITNFNSSVSGLLPSVTGTGYVSSSFNNNTYIISVTGLQPSGNYSTVGHTHTASNITDFNSSVSGLLPVKNISSGSGINVSSTSGNFTISVSGLNSTYISDFNEAIDDRIGSGLFVAGTGISLNYNDSGNSFTISITGLISNPANDRILTSRDSTTTGIDAESALTFDGSILRIDDPTNNQAASLELHNNDSGDGSVSIDLMDSNAVTKIRIFSNDDEDSNYITSYEYPLYISSYPGRLYLSGPSINYIDMGVSSGIDIYAPSGINILSNLKINNQTANTIASFDINKNIFSLATGTYPNLTELSYVKDVTSSIQTQLNGKAASGHTHTSSDITNFNSSVSGLLPSISGSSNINVSSSNNIYTISATGLQTALINPITGTGTTNYISKFSSSSGITNSIIFDSGNRIGIGTASPSGQLHVIGSGIFTSGINIANQTASTIAGFDSTKNIISLSTSTYPSLAELAYVKGVTTGIQTQLNGKSSTGHTHDSADIYVTDLGLAYFGTDDSLTNVIYNIDGAFTSVYTNFSSYQTLLTNPVTGTGIANHIAYWNSTNGIVADNGQLYWDASNNRLGISTTNPSQSLEVSGNIAQTWTGNDQRSAMVFDNNWRMGINYGAGTRTLNIFSTSNDNNGHIIFSTRLGSGTSSTDYGTERMRITSSGVGIGISTPSGQLHIIGTGLFSQKVGIGNNSPTYVLDVTGTGNFSQNLLVNGTGVSVSGHTHTSSQISDFNTSVSGLVSGIYQPLLNNPITGTGTSGYLSRFNSSTDLLNSIIFQSANSIGINTAAPTSQLHVIGTGVFSNTGATSIITIDPDGRSIDSNPSNNFNDINIKANGQNIFRGLDNWTGTWNDAVSTTYYQVGRSAGNTFFTSFLGNPFNRLAYSANKILFTNNTSNLLTPSGYLTIRANIDGGSFGTSGLVLDSTHSSSSANGQNHGGLIVTPLFSTASSNLNTIYGIYISPIHSGTYTTTSSYALYVNATTNLTGTLSNNYAAVFNGGNVGIGTATPSSQLHVIGSGIFSSGINISNQTASTIASFDAAKNIVSLSTATYPSLTELSYVKGVTSAIQTQIGNKADTSTTITAGSGLAGGGSLAANRSLDIGQGDGISVSADSIAVDATVVRTTGSQTISAAYTFASGIVFGNNATISGNLTMSNQTASTIASFDASKNVTSLSTATYPSLTELSYVKGVTSAIQTQINSKQNTLTNPVTGTGIANYSVKWTSSSGVGTGLLIDTGSRVGIAHNSPSGGLHIKNDGGQWSSFNYSPSLLIDGARNNGIGLLDSTSSNPIAIVNNAGSLKIAHMPAIGNTGTAPTDRLILDTSGNFVVGTSAITESNGRFGVTNGSSYLYACDAAYATLTLGPRKASDGFSTVLIYPTGSKFGGGAKYWSHDYGISSYITSFNDGINPTQTLMSLTTAGNLAITGSITASGNVRGDILVSSFSSGSEGGEIQLSKSASGNSISGNNIIIDSFENKLRFFEQGSPNRGFFLTIISGSSTVSTDLTPGILSYNTISPAISGTVNDWNPGTATDVIRVSGISTARINGLVSTYSYDSFLLYNVGTANNVILTHASGTANNQFIIPWGGDCILTPSGGAALIVRDKVDNKWRVT